MNIITLTGIAAAIFTTTSFLPQAIKTIGTKDTSGILLFLYSLFTLGTMLWLLFGLLSNNIPVLTANAVTLIFAMIIFDL